MTAEQEQAWISDILSDTKYRDSRWAQEAALIRTGLLECRTCAKELPEAHRAPMFLWQRRPDHSAEFLGAFCSDSCAEPPKV